MEILAWTIIGIVILCISIYVGIFINDSIGWKNAFAVIAYLSFMAILFIGLPWSIWYLVNH